MQRHADTACGIIVGLRSNLFYFRRILRVASTELRTRQTGAAIEARSVRSSTTKRRTRFT